jgi:hypothetical protein
MIPSTSPRNSEQVDPYVLLLILGQVVHGDLDCVVGAYFEGSVFFDMGDANGSP